MALETSVWIYWFLCGIATTILVINRDQISVLMNPELAGAQSTEAQSTRAESKKPESKRPDTAQTTAPQQGTYNPTHNGYSWAIALGWLTTALAAISYVVLTEKAAIGTYSIQDLLLFTALNGPLEQLMFIGWFLLGCLIAKQLNIRTPWKVFGVGFFTYSTYSGFIHALFWTTVWPAHLFDFIFIRVCFLTLMSISWMWLFWRYRAIGPIICMHMAIDFVTIGHLHFHWFEAYQLDSFLAHISAF